jgi:glucose-6-phosphate 1-dehydrogenase
MSASAPRALGSAAPEAHVIVLFGATGDLARRKLLPGLFHLHAAGLLPEGCRIVGTAPSVGAPSAEGFRAHARTAVGRFATTKPTDQLWAGFERRLDFAPADPPEATSLAGAVARAENAIGGRPRRLFHLAVPPRAFIGVIDMLGSSGLAQGARVVVEKPFGTDLASAQALNAAIHKSFDEDRVYRIDHFLGKESIDNILALRFANGLFEPIWNRDHIAYVQIDVPETLTIEGRAGFYEATGAFKDMVVTHLFQVLGFVAMEPPTTLSAEALAVEKQKVFDSMRPLEPDHAVFGQYDGYRSEPGVAPASVTETFAALRAGVENGRWAGVPFLLRSGKALRQNRQQIVLGLKEPVLRMFSGRSRARSDRSNEIVIDFSDPGAISARFLAKEPGPAMRLGPAEMAFHYKDSFCSANGLAAYEHLILEAMLGDRSLFTTGEQVERLWERSAPLLAAPPGTESYPVGSWGPNSAEALAAPYGWSLSEDA